ncbi:hypothetical protein FM106_19280 [Brachybacterium faecium]|nr:hypothetical protein FM106_19280 [Brachybacterium faecium]
MEKQSPCYHFILIYSYALYIFSEYKSFKKTFHLIQIISKSNKKFLFTYSLLFL